MKALVFAAGLGTRLRPFTLEHPKALVPLAGVPMLQRVLLKLADAGVRTVVVNVHHFASQIVDFLRANRNFGLDLHISDESSLLLDTGGGILKARRWLDDEPFLVHNADIYTDFPIAEMLGRHTASEADVTLLVDRRDTSRYLLFNPTGRMAGWQNRRTGEVLPAGINPDDYKALAFGGAHIWSPRAIHRLEAYAREIGAMDGVEIVKPFPVVPFYVAACQDIRIQAYTPTSPYRWHDVGSPATLASAESTLAE